MYPAEKALDAFFRMPNGPPASPVARLEFYSGAAFQDIAFFKFFPVLQFSHLILYLLVSAPDSLQVPFHYLGL